MAGNGLTKEAIDAGINQDEDERCAHLAEIGRLAKEAGHTVPSSGAPLPELNPDGSYANPEDDMPDAEE
jgi:hypothetical protein